MIEINIEYISSMQFLLNFIGSLFLLLPIGYAFKLSWKKLIPLYVLIYLEISFFDDISMVLLVAVSMSVFLYVFLKIKNLYVIFVPCLSVSIQLCAFSVEKLITYNLFIDYADYFEMLVIHGILLLFIKKLADKKMKLPDGILIHFLLSIVSIGYIFILFLKYKIFKQGTFEQLELYGLGLCAIVLFVIILGYVNFFKTLLMNNESLKENIINNKYFSLTQTEIVNRYNKSLLLNHNMKYVLMNLRIYLENDDNTIALEYINNYLNKISNNKICFTYNPCFDYIINEYDHKSKKENINVDKEIFVDENTYINKENVSFKIKDFLEYVTDYLKSIDSNHYHLSIHQKGDIIIVKAIVKNVTNTLPNDKYNYVVTEDSFIILKLIIERDESYE